MSAGGTEGQKIYDRTPATMLLAVLLKNEIQRILNKAHKIYLPATQIDAEDFYLLVVFFC